MPSKDQVAHFLKKPLPSPRFSLLQDKLTICELSLSLQGHIEVETNHKILSNNPANNSCANINNFKTQSNSHEDKAPTNQIQSDCIMNLK